MMGLLLFFFPSIRRMSFNGVFMKSYVVEYDSNLSCYILHYLGEAVCISAVDNDDAEYKAEVIIATWVHS